MIFFLCLIAILNSELVLSQSEDLPGDWLIETIDVPAVVNDKIEGEISMYVFFFRKRRFLAISV